MLPRLRPAGPPGLRHLVPCTPAPRRRPTAARGLVVPRAAAVSPWPSTALSAVAAVRPSLPSARALSFPCRRAVSTSSSPSAAAAAAAVMSSASATPPPPTPPPARGTGASRGPRPRHGRSPPSRVTREGPSRAAASSDAASTASTARTRTRTPPPPLASASASTLVPTAPVTPPPPAALASTPAPAAPTDTYDPQSLLSAALSVGGQGAVSLKRYRYCLDPVQFEREVFGAQRDPSAPPPGIPLLPLLPTAAFVTSHRPSAAFRQLQQTIRRDQLSLREATTRQRLSTLWSLYWEVHQQAPKDFYYLTASEAHYLCLALCHPQFGQYPYLYLSNLLLTLHSVGRSFGPSEVTMMLHAARRTAKFTFGFHRLTRLWSSVTRFEHHQAQYPQYAWPAYYHTPRMLMAFLDLLSLRWPNELPGWYSSQCEAKTPLYSDDAVPDFRTPRSPRPTTVSYPTHSPSFIVMLVKNTIERPRSLIYKVRNLYEYAAQYVHEPNLWMDRAQLIALIQESKLAEARAFWNTVVVPRWGHTPGDRFDQFWGTLTINLMGAMEHKIITSARSEADPEDVAWVCEIFNLIHTRLGAVPSTELWALYNFLHRTRLKGSCAKIGWHLAHVWIPSPPTAEIHQLLRLWLAGEEKDLKKVEAMFSQVASDGGVLSDALILGFVHAYAECGQPDRGAMYLRAIQDQHRPFPLWMWRSIIRGHLANRNTDGIARVLQEVRENGHEPRPDMIAHYVKALVLGGDVPAAVALIDAASDERSFHALLTGALHAAALRADRQMAQGWMGVLDARGVKPTLKMFNILIHMYATRGDIDAVLTIVQRMGENKYPADAYTYAGIVYVLVQSGRTDEAEKLVRSLSPRDGLVAHNIYLHAVGRGGGGGTGAEAAAARLQRLQTHFARLTDTLQLSVDKFTIDPIVRGLVASGRVAEAHAFVRSAFNTLHVQPDTRVWNTLIAAYAAKGDVHGALALVKEMEGMGCAPDDMTLTALLRARHLSELDGRRDGLPPLPPSPPHEAPASAA